MKILHVMKQVEEFILGKKEESLLEKKRASVRKRKYVKLENHKQSSESRQNPSRTCHFAAI